MLDVMMGGICSFLQSSTIKTGVGSHFRFHIYQDLWHLRESR